MTLSSIPVDELALNTDFLKPIVFAPLHYERLAPAVNRDVPVTIAVPTKAVRDALRDVHPAIVTFEDVRKDLGCLSGHVVVTCAEAIAAPHTKIRRALRIARTRIRQQRFNFVCLTDVLPPHVRWFTLAQTLERHKHAFQNRGTFEARFVEFRQYGRARYAVGVKDTQLDELCRRMETLIDRRYDA